MKITDTGQQDEEPEVERNEEEEEENRAPAERKRFFLFRQAVLFACKQILHVGQRIKPVHHYGLVFSQLLFPERLRSFPSGSALFRAVPLISINQPLFPERLRSLAAHFRADPLISKQRGKNE